MAVFPYILYENDMKLNYKNWQLIVFVSLRYEWKKKWKKKTDVHIFVCARRFFHSYRKETKKINSQFLNGTWMLLSYAVVRANVDCIDSVDQLTTDCRCIDSINRYGRGGLLRVRVDCVDQLTVDRIDRYDWRPLLRVRVDCIDQLTVDLSSVSLDTIEGALQSWLNTSLCLANGYLTILVSQHLVRKTPIDRIDRRVNSYLTILVNQHLVRTTPIGRIDRYRS